MRKTEPETEVKKYLDFFDTRGGPTIARDRPSFFEFHVSTQLLHRLVIFDPSLDECVFLTAV